MLKKLALAAVAASPLLFAGAADAGTASGTINVKLIVTGSCTVAASAVNFANVAFGGAAPADVTGAGGSITCANGTPYTYTVTSANAAAGVFQMKGGATAGLVAYQVKTSGGTNIASGAGGSGTGTAVAQNLNLTFHLTGYTATTAADTYADAVTLTVNY